MENLPLYISLTFGIITLVTLFLFCRTIKGSDLKTAKSNFRIISPALIAWLILQAFLAMNNIYSTHLNSLPPRIVILGILPPVFVILLLFNTKKGKLFIDSLPLLSITYTNTIRFFVEIVLYWLFLHKAIPELMTFEGINFDIMAGITAPFIAYYGIGKSKISINLILWWNIISLALLINIVIIAFLSAPSPLQKLGFDQPNIAILYFPFCWLPTFVVPVIIWGHLVSIRQLFKNKNTYSSTIVKQ
ncbi:hypothetical protein [Chryseobacterium indologenes]|uniref:Uncharacterized protein n=1 Tax=Chryseobacterium indologenes TaxID=253 RepID=A0A0N0IYB9_CHRID|nr:hypothetical protein [Chryseobacterium indologenes]KPE52993.1 hypothetical protein AOB46_03115 [Chryseobacterium indologenes]